jgi:hypothetical protein
MTVCNLCHTESGHTKLCAHMVPVSWSSSGYLWESLARELFELWKTDGGPKHVGDKLFNELDRFLLHVGIMEEALDRGDVHTALEVLRLHIKGDDRA